MANPTKPPLILLVGMHRSGTSLLGSLVSELGVALPGPLIGADRHNPTGYWEHRSVIDLQEQLLRDLSRWWPSQQGVLPLPADWLDHPASRRCKTSLRRLLQREVAAQQGPWAIKDPRTCLLLPLWQQLCQELQIPLRVVLSVREPREVVTSLLQRDSATAGMTAWRAQQLWWRHNLQVLLDTALGELPLHVVDYQRWFDERAPEQLDQLARFCQAQEASAGQRHNALARIRPEHRRSLQAARRRLHWPPLHPRLAQLRQRLDWLTQPANQPEALLPWLHRQPMPLALPLSRLRGRQPSPKLAELPQQLSPVPELQQRQLALLGCSWQQWPGHAWLQHIPLGFELDALELKSDDLPPAREPQPAILHLQPLPSCPLQLGQLRRSPAVYDPDPERCRQLRDLGINAHWLQARWPAANRWLNSIDPSQASLELGLPHPASLLSQPDAVLCLGSGGADFERRMAPPLWCLPGFDQLAIQTIEQARILAAWLNRSQELGLQLVRFHPSQQECQSRAFHALPQPSSGAPHWLPPRAYNTQISPSELLAELAWQRNGCPDPEPCRTPQPEHDRLWEHCSGEPTAAVCISLHNYADQIATALESARLQSHASLELIVVDDASSDGGAEQVLRWLEQHGQRFSRALLLRHRENGGLAAARNTAFAAAQAPWCFVLDADNQLLPDAVRFCLAVADAAPPQVAVVHPLVEIRYVEPDPLPRSLISPLSWQRSHFLQGNVVDAMALVRRSAWQQVGGFAHIPGGWEDYDFWCLLMEAGLHGLLCPQRLAIYSCHNGSMSAQGTRQQEWQLSRVLQARHPWLQLPKAASGDQQAL